MIQPSIQAAIDEHAVAFAIGQPFKHVCLDNFLVGEAVEALCAAFPTASAGPLADEVDTSIAPDATFTEVAGLLLGEDFLRVIGEIAGLPDIALVPGAAGMQAFVQTHGEDAPPRLDANAGGTPRLLSLMLNLTKGWDVDWGGALELHANPRVPAEDKVVAYNARFNRAVLFEASEHSWYALGPMLLPLPMRGAGIVRRGLLLHFQTAMAAESVSAEVPHGLISVPRPLAFELGTTEPLSAAQAAEILNALYQRDRLIEHYQQVEQRLSNQKLIRDSYIARLLAEVRPPVSGPARGQGESRGLFQDGWAGPDLAFSVKPTEHLRGFVLSGWRPESFSDATDIEVLLDGALVGATRITTGGFEVSVAAAIVADSCKIEVRASNSFNGSVAKLNSDNRDLAFMLLDIAFLPTAAGQIRLLRQQLDQLAAALPPVAQSSG